MSWAPQASSHRLHKHAASYVFPPSGCCPVKETMQLSTSNMSIRHHVLKRPTAEDRCDNKALGIRGFRQSCSRARQDVICLSATIGVVGESAQWAAVNVTLQRTGLLQWSICSELRLDGDGLTSPSPSHTSWLHVIGAGSCVQKFG